MVTLGRLTLGSMPCIAAAITDGELRSERELVCRYADVIELRIDRFARHEPSYVADACEQARGLERPLIATVRVAAQGGDADLSDPQRLAAFEAAIPFVDAVDVELRSTICAAVTTLAARHGRLAIVSHHDFTATPSEAELVDMWKAADQLDGANIFKIAGYANDTRDIERLLDFLRSRRTRGLIVLAMGPHGVASRVFFPLLGSLITYGYVSTPGAAGQLSLAELYAELRRYSPEFAAAHA
jgi:3-dehydroquinate dehydratase-1